MTVPPTGPVPRRGPIPPDASTRDGERYADVYGADYELWERHHEVIEFALAAVGDTPPDRAVILLTKTRRRSEPGGGAARGGAGRAAAQGEAAGMHLVGAAAGGSTDGYDVHAQVLHYHRGATGTRYDTNDRVSWSWDVEVDLRARRVTFAAGNDLVIPRDSLQGGGLGSYLMSDLIAFAAERYPNFSVAPLTLAPGDGDTDAKRRRRNGFYRRLGFTIRPHDDATSGSAVVARVRDLVLDRAEGRVTRVPLDAALRETVDAASRATFAAGQERGRAVALERWARYERRRRVGAVVATALIAGLFVGVAIHNGYLAVRRPPTLPGVGRGS